MPTTIALGGMTNVSVFVAAANSGEDDRQDGKAIDDVNGVTKCGEKYFGRCAPALRRFDLFHGHAAAIQTIGEQKTGQGDADNRADARRGHGHAGGGADLIPWDGAQDRALIG